MLIKFSERVYYTKQRYMYLEPAIGYIKGDNYSVMIDTGNGPEQVNNFLDDLKSQNLPLPSYAILTHHHWDHSFGASSLDIPVISTKKAAEELEILKNMNWDDKSIEERVANGTEIRYSADVLKKVYANETINIRIPDIQKVGDMTMDIGNEKITCLYSDNSHSDDAFLVYIPKEKVLFLGDSHAKNYYTNPMSYNKEKLRTYIDKIEKLDFEYAIPGHGNIFTREALLAYLEKEYSKMR